MNVVDSSAWLEYFGDGPTASEFAAAIEAPDELVVGREIVGAQGQQPAQHPRMRIERAQQHVILELLRGDAPILAVTVINHF